MDGIVHRGGRNQKKIVWYVRYFFRPAWRRTVSYAAESTALLCFDRISYICMYLAALLHAGAVLYAAAALTADDLPSMRLLRTLADCINFRILAGVPRVWSKLPIRRLHQITSTQSATKISSRWCFNL